MPKRRILIVDDEKDICESLTSHFEEEGFTVDVAHNGREALQQIHAHKPSVVVLDIFMPVMDGVTFLNELRREEENTDDMIPVILITACYMEGMMKGLPVSAVVQKPILFDELLSEVKQTLKN